MCIKHMYMQHVFMYVYMYIRTHTYIFCPYVVCTYVLYMYVFIMYVNMYRYIDSL
jgi:hypothetical protein